MNVQPWLGAIKKPSSTPEEKSITDNQISIKTELIRAHGYRTKDIRGNLRILKKPNLLLYVTATIAVVHNIEDNSQSFFT